MRPASDVEEVFRLHDSGGSLSAIARSTGVSRSQVRAWIRRGKPDVLGSPMRMARGHDPAGGCPLLSQADPAAYAYLLGQYLGDGCLSPAARGVWKLRISSCDDYPDIRAETVAAIKAVVPGRRVGFVQGQGCTEVYSHSKHWLCLFPQHGRGRKHERPIQLEPWQEALVAAHPAAVVRGLIHSDGCRVINRVRVRGRRYEYVRYLLTNESPDILAIFEKACALLGIESRRNRRNSVSVARRASVAILEEIVGPKT